MIAPAHPAAAPHALLLLDDDRAYCAQLADYLALHGCAVAAAHTAGEFEARLAAGRYDLVLLDQRLGGTTGTEVLKRMRQRSGLPCIIITGRSDPLDRIVNLEVGADDEIDKAAPPRELLARIRAVLRRGGSGTPDGALPSPAAPAGDGGTGWRFCAARGVLRRPDGSRCHLTKAEAALLQALVEARGRPVPRALLSERALGRGLAAGDRAVDTLVKKLRRKIEPGGRPVSILTVRPVGYVFTGFA